MPDSRLARLRLLQITSPTLPTGAFTYSQGLEWAVECRWVCDEPDVKNWLQTVLNDSLQYLELPILVRLLDAVCANNHEKFQYWSHRLYASRETSELRDEEIQRARALHSVLGNLPDTQSWAELDNWREALLKCQLGGYSVAAKYWLIDQADLLQGFAWSWLENAVAAAIKLVPLGQSEGQRLLFEISPDIDKAVEYASSVSDDMIGASTPALAIASSLHETQYCRLFRS